MIICIYTICIYISFLKFVININIIKYKSERDIRSNFIDTFNWPCLKDEKKNIYNVYNINNLHLDVCAFTFKSFLFYLQI